MTDSGVPPDALLSARGLRFAVVASRFNNDIVDDLLQEALNCLRELGAAPGDVRVVRVPGAFEIPLAARLLFERGQVDAIVALGAVVRGETSHHLHLGQEVLAALGRLSTETRVAVSCGVLTTENEAQARARSRPGDPQNRGRHAARAAVEMARVVRELRD
jgi:6,7-dimethyl-8-ribityllumazine synthase